jgi:hypothetical protein
MTVENFLHTITLGRSAEAWVVSVPPGAPTNDPLWFGGRPGTVPIGDQAPDNAQYYATGLVHQNDPAVRGRKASNWTAATVLVLDDIGEKSIDPAKVRECLGDPTFAIQTSKGSCQWGYVYTSALTGEAGKITQLRLQLAATLAFYPKQKDPGHQGLVQLVRLPYGSNNKPARIAENGGKPWPVTLVEWRPELRHAVVDLQMALGDTWDQTAHVNGAVSVVGSITPEEAIAAVEADPTLSALAKAGKIDPAAVNANGYIPVVPCLWASGHTGGEDDGRAGIHPVSKHYRCFHGSCAGRTFAELKAYVKGLAPETYEAERKRIVGQWFSVIEDAAEDAVGKALGRGTLSGNDDLVSVLKNPPPGLPPARRSICNHLARGEVSQLLGGSSVGKSSVSLAYAVAIAYNRPDLIGETILERTGNVVIVSNEDTADDVRKRIRGLLIQHKLAGTQPAHDITVVPIRYFKAVVQDGGRGEVQLSDEMAKWLPSKMAKLGDVCLVVLDTQAATFAGLNENDNAAIGQAYVKLGSWAEAHNVAVQVIHHGAKTDGLSGGKGKIYFGRGASAGAASVRNGITLTELEEHELEKVPPHERKSWVREVVSKSSHTAGAGSVKWWWKTQQSVQVLKTDVLDEAGQPTLGEQPVGVYVYRAQGPAALDFRAAEHSKLLAAVQTVAAAERTKKPLRVHAAKTGEHAGVSAVGVLAEANEWHEDNAKDVLDAAEKADLIERVKDVDAKNHPLVWSVTKKGLAMIAEAEKVLERVEDEDGGVKE